MNGAHQDDFSNHAQSGIILVASVVFMVTALMPSLLDTSLGLKAEWLWQKIDFSQTSVAIMKITEILVMLIPLIIYRFLSKRKAVVTILVYVIALGIYAVTQAPHALAPGSMKDIFAKFAIGFVIIFAFLLMAVASRLALSQPTRKYPFILLFFTSLIFILLYVAADLSKGLGTYSSLFNFAGWRYSPLRQFLNLSFALLLIYTFLSSFKIVTSRIIVPFIYFLMIVVALALMQRVLDNPSPSSIVGIYHIGQILIMTIAYFALFSASLYASLYLLGSRHSA